jgi:hypothetical protein
MATLTVVASLNTPVAGVPVNSSRGGLVIENDDANRLYVLLGPGTVSSTNRSFSLAQNENAFLPNCTDKVSLIWAADGSGNAYITEYDN